VIVRSTEGYRKEARLDMSNTLTSGVKACRAPMSSSKVAATPAILAIDGNKINSLSADEVACSGRRRRRRRDDIAATDSSVTKLLWAYCSIICVTRESNAEKRRDRPATTNSKSKTSRDMSTVKFYSVGSNNNQPSDYNASTSRFKEQVNSVQEQVYQLQDHDMTTQQPTMVAYHF
jgi:hypothetical protein